MDEKIRFTERVQHAWNAFINKNSSTDHMKNNQNGGTSYRPDKVRIAMGTEKTITTAVYNRIAMDVASASIQHVRLNDENKYLETVEGPFNECLTLNPNLDQTSVGLFQDLVYSMFDEGVVALVPIDTTEDPKITDAFKIHSLRTGKILEWYPQHIKVRVYNEKTGAKEDLILPKKTVAIIENPLYVVMNEPNSTLKRLIYKLSLLDVVDSQSSSGKLDLIIQLPYVVKSEARREQAEKRREDIEFQLSGSKYGIAYIDGTERVTQLNRPAENNLMKQIEYLTSMLYSQLGLTMGVFDGTADEKTMLNYYSRSVEPILNVIILEMKRKFLSKTARSQKQSIMYFRDPFKLVPVKELAEMADTFTRNEIMSSNEIRAIIGYKPSSDKGADELRNKNINMKTDQGSELPLEKGKMVKEKEDKV